MQPQSAVDHRPEFDSAPAPAKVYGLLQTQNGTQLDMDQEARDASFIEGTEIGSTVWTYHNVEYSKSINNNVISPYLEFWPHWDGESSFDTAYKIYKWKLTWYSTPTTMTFDWLHPPSGVQGSSRWSKYWVGLANVHTGIWTWYEGPEDFSLTVADLAPYIDPYGVVLVNILVTGTKDSPALRSMNMNGSEMRGLGGDEFTAEMYYPIPNVAYTSVPASCDISGILPAAGDQYQTGSCMTWAFVNGALNYELSKIYGPYGWDINNTARQASPRYVYVEAAYRYNMTPGVFTGPNPRELLLDDGTPTEADVPWNSWDPSFDDRVYSAQAMDDRRYLDIEDYWVLKSPLSNPNFLNDIKAVIANHRRPVVIFANVDSGPDGFTLYYPPPTGPTEVWTYGGPLYGAHAMLAVGYDDALQAVKLRNSWGAGWGYNGYIWASYANFVSGNCVTAGIFVKDEFNQETMGHFLAYLPYLRPPQWVRASAGTFSDHIAIEWEGIPGATGYDVCRDTESGAFISVMAPNHSYSDYSMIARDNKSHAYWIRAYYNYNNGIQTSELSRPDIGFTAPGGPAPGL